MIYYICERYHK